MKRVTVKRTSPVNVQVTFNLTDGALRALLAALSTYQTAVGRDNIMTTKIALLEAGEREHASILPSIID